MTTPELRQAQTHEYSRVLSIGAFRPSVVVTIGAPLPGSALHQAVATEGGGPARICSTVSPLPRLDAGQCAPRPRMAT